MRVYNILSFPQSVGFTEDRGYLSQLLNSLKNIELFEKDVDYYYESFNKPYHITFDKKTKQKYEGLGKMKANIEAQLDKSETKQSTARDKELKTITNNDVLEFRLNEVNKKMNSYNIIRANQNRGKSQIESFQFIRMVCKKKDLLETAEKELITRLKSVDITIKQVKDLSEYFETFSPVSGLYALDHNNDYASNIFTTQGYSKIRNKPTRIMENELRGLSRLVLLGTDIATLEPLALSFTSSGDGQNILIVGATGSGKTYLFESLMMNSGLLRFKFNVMDYKGSEYACMADIIPNSITLDFGTDSPKFINTMKFIPELYEKSEWQKAFTMNTEATVRSLRMLSGVTENIKAAENALEDMIRGIYSSHKVYYEDPDSYYNTRHVDYFKDIGDALNIFRQDTFRSVYGENVCRELFSGLTSYFSPLSHRSYMFTEEIDLGEVLNKDCIIYDFNMNKDSQWDSRMVYKIYNLDYVSNLFIQKNKKEGYTTFNSLEEYQRAVNYEDLRKIYNSKFSGGRSDNVINVVLTNTVRPLLDKNSFDISAIRENISTVFVGKLKSKEALDDFCEAFGMQEAINEIEKLQDYQYAFYCNYDTGRQKGGRIIKALHPAYISNYLETKTIDKQVM